MRERGEERERIKNRDFQKEMSGKQRMRGGEERVQELGKGRRSEDGICDEA